MNWLLLRGLAREQRHWGEFPEAMKNALSGASIHCLDLPGTGTENGRPSPTSVEGIAEDIRSRWLKLKSSVSAQASPQASKEPWALLGISLGGMVSLDWVARHPEDFSRLAIINSSAANTSLPHDRLNPEVLPALLKALMSRDSVEIEIEVLKATTRMQSDILGRAEAWAKLASDRPLHVTTPVLQLAAAARFLAPERVPLPLLVLSSDRDGFTNPACSVSLANRYQAQLVRHPEAGHELPLDAPGWVAEQLARWLS